MVGSITSTEYLLPSAKCLTMNHDPLSASLEERRESRSGLQPLLPLSLTLKYSWTVDSTRRFPQLQHIRSHIPGMLKLTMCLSPVYHLLCHQQAHQHDRSVSDQREDSKKATLYSVSSARVNSSDESTEMYLEVTSSPAKRLVDTVEFLFIIPEALYSQRLTSLPLKNPAHRSHIVEVIPVILNKNICLCSS